MTLTKRVFAALIAALLFVLPCVHADDETPDAFAIAADIAAYKKAEAGVARDGDLLCGGLLAQAGTTACDWYAIALARLGMEDDYAAYLAVLKENVTERYAQEGKLSAAKATEWHRISLAVAAAGGDPRAFGTDRDGGAIDLIADGTYDRGLTAPLDRQGVNGPIWALIALNSGRYEVPDGAYSARRDIIADIISRRLCDGGFAAAGDDAEPDMTAMALQALALCADDANEYTTAAGDAVTVGEVIETALARLSEMQLETGDFPLRGTPNAESTAQVIIALCTLGVDPASDERFIKNGRSAVDGLLLYRADNGGFAHTRASLVPDDMACAQSMCALAALYRYQNGMSPLYDMSGESSTVAPSDARFTEADMTAADGLPDPITTAEKPVVTALLEKLTACGDFPEKEKYMKILCGAKAEIEALESEIAALNAEIEALGDVGSLTIADKGAVEALMQRYEKLPDADRAKVAGGDRIAAASAKIAGLVRGRISGGALAAVAVVTVASIVVRAVKRRRAKTDGRW